MNCNYPVTIYDKKHNRTIQVPCGKCILCCAAKAHDWQNRLKHQFNHEMITFFVTITYSDDYLPLMPKLFAVTPPLKADKLQFRLKLLSTQHNTNYRTNLTDFVPCLNPHDLTNYFKRLRINLTREHEKNQLKPPTIQYFAVGEYGPQTFRPHYHFIIGFDITYSNYDLLRSLTSNERRRQNRCNICSLRDYFALFIQESWPFGHIKLDELNEERIQYVTKYVYKFTDAVLIEHFKQFPGIIQPFKRSSNGIGERYVNANIRHLRNTNTLRVNGYVNRVPRYYRNKVKERLNESELKDYEDKIAYTPEKENQINQKQLDYFCSLTHTPHHTNIYDQDFMHWQDMHIQEKIRKLKQSFKKRKL